MHDIIPSIRLGAFNAAATGDLEPLMQVLDQAARAGCSEPEMALAVFDGYHRAETLRSLRPSARPVQSFSTP